MVQPDIVGAVRWDEDSVRGSYSAARYSACSASRVVEMVHTVMLQLFMYALRAFPDSIASIVMLYFLGARQQKFLRRA